MEVSDLSLSHSLSLKDTSIFFSSSAHVQIFIRDQNDNFPEFTQPVYNAGVPENSEAGTIISQVEAIDVDSGDFGSLGIRYTNLRGGIAHL